MANESHIEGRIAHLDGLRGLAILSVILFHAYSRWNSIEPWAHNQFISKLFVNGWLGVELFFIISGFVIYWSLDKCSGILEFGVKRWLRLFPAMLMSSIFIFLTAHFIPDRPAGLPHAYDAVPGLTFIEPYLWERIFGLHLNDLDGVFWSLYIEVKFYIIAGLSYFLFREKKGLLISLLYVLYCIFAFASTLGEKSHLISSGMGALTLIGVQYYGWFLVGIFFYQYWKSRKFSKAMWSMFFGCLAVSATAAGKDISVLILSVVVLMVFWLSFFSAQFSALISSRLFTWLGFISYPLYLVHQNFVIGLGIELYHFDSKLWGWFYPEIPLIFALCIAHFFAKSEPFVRNFFARRLNMFIAPRYS